MVDNFVFPTSNARDIWLLDLTPKVLFASLRPDILGRSSTFSYHIVSKAVASQNVMKLLTKEVSVEVLTAGSPTQWLLKDIQGSCGKMTSFDQLDVASCNY